MQVDENITEIPYKIDTSSEGNIMPLYIFKKLFKNMLAEQLKGSIKSKIKLKMYNRTHVTQLGTYAVTLKLKKCVFFVVWGNGQALLGMPDIAALKILNLNIDSIQVEVGSYKINREQETHKVTEGCTNINTIAVIKQTANGQIQSSKLINYFYSSKNTEADKRESDVMTQKIHDTYGNVFNGIGCF